VRPDAREETRAIYQDMLTLRSPEARFIKTVDKLEALLFVLIKKDGHFTDEHLRFNLEYTRKYLSCFPRLIWHFEEVRRRYINRTAEMRGIDPAELGLALERVSL
jgi:5'-deoxynucleotidase YfbR-like HD superfamily hydrolase